MHGHVLCLCDWELNLFVFHILRKGRFCVFSKVILVLCTLSCESNSLARNKQKLKSWNSIWRRYSPRKYLIYLELCKWFVVKEFQWNLSHSRNSFVRFSVWVHIPIPTCRRGSATQEKKMVRKQRCLSYQLQHTPENIGESEAEGLTMPNYQISKLMSVGLIICLYIHTYLIFSFCWHFWAHSVSSFITLKPQRMWLRSLSVHAPLKKINWIHLFSVRPRPPSGGERSWFPLSSPPRFTPRTWKPGAERSGEERRHTNAFSLFQSAIPFLGICPKILGF